METHITNVGAPVAGTDAVNKNYLVDVTSNAAGFYVQKGGDSMSGGLFVGSSMMVSGVMGTGSTLHVGDEMRAQSNVVSEMGDVQVNQAAQGYKIGANYVLRTGSVASNLFVGNSGNGSATGAGNVLVGYNSGTGLTWGANNTALGSGALASLTSGSINTAVGSNAMAINGGGENSAFGYSAMSENLTGSFNAAFGNSALQGLGSGNSASATGNAAFGYQALSGAVGAGYNVAIGFQASRSNQSGSNNVTVGAGSGNNFGSYNVMLGSDAGAGGAWGDNNVFIGYQAGSGLSTSNQLIIRSNGYDLITGDFSQRTIAANGSLTVTGANIFGSPIMELRDNSGTIKMTMDYYGNVGIGTTTPSAALHVAGTIQGDQGLLLGTTIRDQTNGGRIPSFGGRSDVIMRSIVSTGSTYPVEVFKTTNWVLEKSGLNEFKLTSLVSANLDYNVTTGALVYEGDVTTLGSSVVFDVTGHNSFDALFGLAFSSPYEFTHIVIHRYSTDYYWVGYVITNVNN